MNTAPGTDYAPNDVRELADRWVGWKWRWPIAVDGPPNGPVELRKSHKGLSLVGSRVVSGGSTVKTDDGRVHVVALAGVSAIFSPVPLDALELRTLLGWVREEMEREVEQRALVRSAAEAEALRMFGGHQEWRHGVERLRMVQRHQPQFDGLLDNDREALTRHIAMRLGGVFIDQDAHVRSLRRGERGLARALCEAAGWPS